MEYIIKGNQALKGTVTLSGAKNVALKLLIAALLTEGKSVIRNLPRIKDVEILINIINQLGGEVRYLNEHTVEVENKLKHYQVPIEFSGKIRVSFLLIVPLLFTFGKAVIPNPGGCRLGTRPVDRLIQALERFGVNIRYEPKDGFFYAYTNNKTPVKQISFSKKTHTGTELAIMYAAKLNQATTILNPAEEPEIADLIKYLKQGGARFKKQPGKLIIQGSKTLKSSQITVQSDRNEAVSFMVLSCLFKGKIKIRAVSLTHLSFFTNKLEQAGFDYQYKREIREVIIQSPKQIKPVNIQTAPHPGFMTDWQPLWALLMSQAHGISELHETVFEDRFGYVSELRKFGVEVNFWQPIISRDKSIYQFDWKKNKPKQQAIRIKGPVELHNAYTRMTDIRAGACLVFAALIAKGTSVISGAEQIERGYENLIGKLKSLGAEIAIKA